MGFVQYLVAVLMLSAQRTFTSPVSQGTYSSQCNWCPAGEYSASCSKCEPCPPNQYTTETNKESSCHRCFGDCRPEYNLIVVQNCSSTSDLECICAAGFRCTEQAPYSMNCRECVKIQDTTTPEATTVGTLKATTMVTLKATTMVTPTEDKQSPSSASTEHGRTSPKLCQFSKCDPQPIADDYSGQLAAILCPLVALACVSLILLCVRGPRDRTCFRQTIAKLCHEERQDASHKQRESTHQFPRDSFSAKQQSSSLSASNLGPVHVHNPGTVIFSLLNHFTGQVGPTIVGGKTTERVSSEEEDERDCPVFHPTSPHSIHLSEEERSGEIDSIFFPSQEQGKDCHVSKEEAL